MSKEKLQERLQLFHDAINCRKPSRIPTLANIFTWKILDSDLNVKISEATSDWELMEKIVIEHHERYQFDSYFDLGTRNNNKLTEILGTQQHVVDDEKELVYALDTEVMLPDEYEEYAADPIMFTWTKIAPRKYNSLTYQQLHDAVQEVIKFGQFSQKMPALFKTKYGVPELSVDTLLVPVETLFNFLRGIHGFSLDMRKQPEKIKDFIAAMEPALFASLDKILAQPTDDYVCTLRTAFLAHSVMSTKQFAEFYWSTFKKIIDKFRAHNKTIYIFCEAEFLRFAEFFQDVPPGTLVVHLEQDDIFAVRKKVPNLCLAGGMPVDLLGNATPEKCVDYAKMLIDELGDGGYIFSQNKMMSFSYDAKRENLLAVQDFVLNYKL